jgi:hypothetical protein
VADKQRNERDDDKVTREEFEQLKHKVDDLESLWDKVRNMLLTVAGIYRGVKGDKGEHKDEK